MAEDPKPPRSARAKKPTLVEIPCPDQCNRGQVLSFDYTTGTHVHDNCTRCMGAGVVEVQR